MKKFFALGPMGTNGHEAAKKILERLGRHDLEISFCNRNTDILERAATEGCYGIVPIENTTAGYVSEVVRFWLTKGGVQLYVIGEIQLPIEHHLLVRPEVIELEQITQVLSHPQALAQCERVLYELGITTRTPTTSTAEAAKKVATDMSFKQTAAIASRFAGETFGLKVLRANIEDFPGNSTRFHLVGPGPALPALFS